MNELYPKFTQVKISLSFIAHLTRPKIGFPFLVSLRGIFFSHCLFHIHIVNILKKKNFPFYIYFRIICWNYSLFLVVCPPNLFFFFFFLVYIFHGKKIVRYSAACTSGHGPDWWIFFNPTYHGLVKITQPNPRKSGWIKLDPQIGQFFFFFLTNWTLEQNFYKIINKMNRRFMILFYRINNLTCFGWLR